MYFEKSILKTLEDFCVLGIVRNASESSRPKVFEGENFIFIFKALLNWDAALSLNFFSLGHSLIAFADHWSMVEMD